MYSGVRPASVYNCIYCFRRAPLSSVLPRAVCYPAAMTRLVLRLHFDTANRLGPGKVELLERIAATGSISAAGRAMNMSYRRAWLLVDAMNHTFGAPVVATRIGGASEGRARLTPVGWEVVALYRNIEAVARDAADAPIARLEQLLANGARTDGAVEPARDGLDRRP